jgi:hypothetical protein
MNGFARRTASQLVISLLEKGAFVIKQWTIAVLAVGIAAVGSDSSLIGQFKGSKGDFGRSSWLGSLDQGKALARETGKPLMVVIRCVP